ncbi:hypothetical protein [Xanthobacter flavus]|uniref:hypothetical protein n=1 Tax=Xanthobacter flavus TaxID=281 RepID=UPI003728C6F9
MQAIVASTSRLADVALLRHALQLALQPADLSGLIVIADHGDRLAEGVQKSRGGSLENSGVRA